MDSGGRRGGTIKVLDYVQDHPIELAYDFRHKFNLSIEDIGGTVTLYEAVLLIASLLQQTDSQLQAVVNDWDYAVSREWILLRDIYDAFAQANFKKPTPYPTPWLSENTKKIGGKSKQSKADVLARLNQMNPEEDNGK